MILEDGRQYKGDILVGADGIWSQVGYPLFSLYCLMNILFITQIF